jgi:ATP-dependent Lon protease
VSRMDQVIERALVRKPEAIEWNFDETPAAAKAVDSVADDAAAGLPH